MFQGRLARKDQAVPVDPANLPVDRGPSIPPAQRPAVLPDQAAPVDPADAPVSAHVPDSEDHPVLVWAEHVPVDLAAVCRLLAKHRARRVLHREAVVEERIIQRPKKAR